MSSSRNFKPREKWKVLLRENHDGYITWQEYEEHLSMLKSNAASRQPNASGVAKKGAALLSGLLRCAHCGRKLFVGYSGSGQRPRYLCHGGRDARTLLDAANDDKNEKDEDNKPFTAKHQVTGNDESIMYSFDAPGLDKNPTSFRNETLWRLDSTNFEEFVRVNVNNIDPIGGGHDLADNAAEGEVSPKLLGSRASHKVKWYSRQQLLADDSNFWKRCCNGSTYDEHNKISDGQIDLDP